MSGDFANRAGQLATFLAEPSPRRFVPSGIRRAALRQSAPWALALFGTVFGTIGLGIGGMFLPWKIGQDWKLADGATAPGQVLSVSRTNMSINKNQVMRYEFAFQPGSGGRRRGQCYTTGTRWTEGDAVTVRYLPDNPAVSCISGARSSQGSPGALFVLLFPLIGYSVVGWFFWARRRTRILLERGEVAEAEVMAIEETATRVNQNYVQKITLKRTDGDTMVVHYYQPALVAFARDRLASKQPVFVLYDRANPQRALLPETLL